MKFWKAFDRIKFLYKDDAYRDEKEYRYVIVAPKESNIKYHFKDNGPYLRKYIIDDQLRTKNILVSGIKIFVGPRVENSKRLCRNLEKLARQTQTFGAKVSSFHYSLPKCLVNNPFISEAMYEYHLDSSCVFILVEVM